MILEKPDGCLQISFCRFHVHFGEVFHQQAVDEDISATDAAQEDQVNAVVEERDESPREEVVAGEDKAESVVLDIKIPAIN